MERRSLEGLPYVSFVASGFSRMGSLAVRGPIRLKADATYAYLVASAFGRMRSSVRHALIATIALAFTLALIGCGKKGADEE